MKKSLTIAIPTYNRKEYILGQVKSLVDIVIKNKLENDIEILVSDNNSKYNIYDLLEEYKKYSTFLTISKNDENIGMGRNICKTFNLAKGEFYFFIGDDDRLSANGILYLLKNCKSTDASLINMRGDLSIGWGKYFPKTVDYKSRSKSNMLNEIDIYYFANANTAVKKSRVRNDLISSSKEAQEHPMSHAIIFLSALATKDKMVFCNCPILNNSYPNVITSSYSYILSRLIFHATVEQIFSKTHMNQLNQNKFFKRHPLLKIDSYALHIVSFTYKFHIEDNKEEKLCSVNFLKNKNSRLIPAPLHLFLTLSTTNVFFIFLKNLFYIMGFVKPKFRLYEKNSIAAKNKKIESMKNNSMHYWGLGIGN